LNVVHCDLLPFQWQFIDGAKKKWQFIDQILVL